MLFTTFQIPDPTRPIPEDQQSPCGPSAELMPFKPSPVAPAEIAGRTVDEISSNGGVYGMGGPGFFALRFGETWLVIALWGAGDWLRVNGRLITDMYYDVGGRPPPWISETGDDLSPLLCGRTLVAISVEPHSMQMSFTGGVELTLAASPKDRPVFQGNGQPRAFGAEQDLRQSVFVAPTIELWI